jgi:hypothetical protein
MEFFTDPFYGGEQNYEDDEEKKYKPDINKQVELELLKEDLRRNQQQLKQLEMQNQIIKQQVQKQVHKQEPEKTNDYLFDISNNRLLLLMIFLLIMFCVLQQQSHKNQIKDLSLMLLQNIQGTNSTLNTRDSPNIVAPVDTPTGLTLQQPIQQAQ